MAVRRLKHGFGAVVRECRLEKGLSQEQLAFDAGLTRNFISLVELGQRSPTLDTVEVVAKALDISASSLIARAERKQR
jgi:transcriptional regulator with XRE-family HTH domain